MKNIQLQMCSTENSILTKVDKASSAVEVPKETGDQEGEPIQLIQYQGFWYTPAVVEKIRSAQDQFVAHPGDILLCTFPKTGTTWLKSLTFAITTRSQYNDVNSQSPLLTELPHCCIPYIEHSFGGNTFKECLGGKHRLVATHMPYTSLPSSVIDLLGTGSCKMVYIYRDPKDTLVSMWHFLNQLTLNIPFDDFVEMFCEGKVVYGPYWNHLLGYWEVHKEHPEAILFLRYEDLKRNSEKNVKKLAEFLGCPFTLAEKEAGEVEKIIQMCSIENMSKLEVNQTGTYEDLLMPQLPLKNNVFFRKGEVGDWKNMMTPDMEKMVDLTFDEKVKQFGISLLNVEP